MAAMSEADDVDILAVHTDERLKDLPGSAREIATLVALDGPMTPSAIAAELGYSYRLVCSRLGELRRRDIVDRQVDSRDARRVFYDIRGM